MKEQESTKLEFLITLNNNIVVQRFFNVRDFNSDAKDSIELYEFIKDFKDSLHYELKMKTVIYMIDNKDAIMENPSVMDTSFTEESENFNIIIKNGEQTICHRIMDAKLYPPKIRYTVDVRPFLKELLRGLTDIFSTPKLSFEYLGYHLSR